MKYKIRNVIGGTKVFTTKNEAEQFCIDNQLSFSKIETLYQYK